MQIIDKFTLTVILNSETTKEDQTQSIIQSTKNLVQLLNVPHLKEKRINRI